MLYDFLANNAADLVQRCITKVAQRPKRNATQEQLCNGIPMFLGQLIKTLQTESESGSDAGMRISGASGGAGSQASEMGLSASAHGSALFALGYTIGQVVHDYGDLCQAITDLAVERNAPFAVDEFRTLNRCLDNAIADAVTEFSIQRDASIAEQQATDANERLGFLMHELRNALNNAILAASAMETGQLPMIGSTGAVLKRSHAAIAQLVGKSLDEVCDKATAHAASGLFPLAPFVAEAAESARLDAAARGCIFELVPVNDPGVAIDGHRDLLLAALGNLLQNAFKFTRPHTRVVLHAHVADDTVRIDVRDHCGGLAIDDPEQLFQAFTQHHDDRSGLGLGLTIARRNVIADSGRLEVANMPGTGCVFTIALPRHTTS